MSSRLSYALAILIMLFAMGLRLWDITTLPYGYNEDEILNVRITETIQQGAIEVFYTVNGEGHEGLHQMIMALTTIVTGDGTLGYRIVSVWAGMLALALVYTLGVRLYGVIAGLMAMMILSVTFLSVLMARMVTTEALVPLIMAGGLLSLARAMPVYRIIRDDTTNTLVFAVMGTVLGLGLYAHPVGLILILIAMVFIAFVILTVRPLSYIRLSLISFSILMMLIVAMPYLISSINSSTNIGDVPEIENFGTVIGSVGESIRGLFLSSTDNPVYNLPLRPVMEPVSIILVLVGIASAIRQWRQPRNALLLITFALIIPAVVLAATPPDQKAFVLLLVPIALAFGLGVQTIYEHGNEAIQWTLAGVVILLFLFNISWTASDLFIHWRNLPERQTAYHDDLGQIAHHLDVTAGDLPTVLCYPDWANQETRPAFSTPEFVLILMNRVHANIRYIDCSHSLLFIDGGNRQQLVLADGGQLGTMPPYLQELVGWGDFLEQDNIPDERVVLFDVQERLANAAGVFTTTSPATYGIEVLASESNGNTNRLNVEAVIPPPIRFGGNITWLGYVPPDTVVYEAAEFVQLINYWRVEGIVPRDLVLFHHILSDPVTVVDNRDEIFVNPLQLQERDVFIQVTSIPLSATLSSGEYVLSIGTYQQTSQERLAVFEGTETRGNRLFLYRIQVNALPQEDNGNGTDDQGADTGTP